MPEQVPVRHGLFRYPAPAGEAPRLLGSRCLTCGVTYFPRRALCPTCLDGGRLEETPLDRRAVIHACTVVHVTSPTGLRPPYAYGYVDVPADRVRVFALFTGADPTSFAPGQEVEPVLEPLGVDAQGREVIAHKFRPRAQEASRE